MTVVASLDIGNSTTEAVLARAGPAGALTVLAADRIPARGPKGSAASLDAVAATTAGNGVAIGPPVPLRAAATASPGQPAQAAS